MRQTKKTDEKEEDEDAKPISDEQLTEAYNAVLEAAASMNYDSVMLLLDTLGRYKLTSEQKGHVDAVRDMTQKLEWEKLVEYVGKLV